MNIWKSYIWTADKDVNMKVIFTVLNTSWAVVKIRPEKIQACTEFEPMTPAILVQCSTNWANKPTGSWSLCWFQINPWGGEQTTVNIWKSYVWTVVVNVNVVDLNECVIGTHNCHADSNCSNTKGSFYCTCLTGYSGDGVGCVGMYGNVCFMTNDSIDQVLS